MTKRKGKGKGKAARLYRCSAGSYFTREAVRVFGRWTHVRIEESDGGSFWRLRLTEFPEFEEVTETYTGAKRALAMLMAGALDPVFA